MSLHAAGGQVGPTGPELSPETHEPSPPRPPSGRAESLKLVGGLVVVCSGLAALVIIAVVAMLLIKDSATNVVGIGAAAFGVIGTVVGAYFGVKVGTDSTQTAVSGMRDEATKAQVFAAHLPQEAADAALRHASELLHR